MTAENCTATSISLIGTTVVVPSGCDETIAYAAAELSRFLYLLGGQGCHVTNAAPEVGSTVVLSTDEPSAMQEAAAVRPFGDQSFHLAAFSQAERCGVAVSAGTATGVLYGVYRLLEELGMGFYAGGETYPDLPTSLSISVDFETHEQPAFAIRGNMLHYNFLCGPTNWGLADYKFYFDQLARMRCNMLIMHWYDVEPGAAYHEEGEYRAGGVTPNSLTKPWGALAALRTSEFSFGSGRFYDAETFTSPMAVDAPDLLSEIRETERVWREATRYARRAGIGIAAGFEAPRGDPTDPVVMAGFKERMWQFLGRNPHLTHFALWQHESGACFGTTPPSSDTDAAVMLESRRQIFAHLGTDRRIWEAARYGAFALEAAAILAEERPELRLVVIGWGGDRWMRFADLCLGYDKMLPKDVIFTCHDNIDSSFGPEVSTPWGQLPPERERWAMPWVEGDIDECWVRQPNVEILGKLAPDAMDKGCQGLLTLQWRTRDVEEETGFIAQFAWNPTLTPQQFYRRLARHSFGSDNEEEMCDLLEELQQLGARWTGVRGCGECSRMQWTGWTPHIPFELDSSACAFLEPMAVAAAETLAVIPVDTADNEDGAFHERSEQDSGVEAEKDFSRLGVREFQSVIEKLKILAAETNTIRLREGLIELEESIWAVRPALVASGMNSPSYQAVDKFLITIHHLQRNAGAARKMARLNEIRTRLEALRERCTAAGQTARFERIDYLDATIAFVLGFDSAAMLMADNELVEQALNRAEEAAEEAAEEDPEEAAAVAAVAYADLLAAGMQDAIIAFTRKLTTRCDFGTLATINVKAMPLYWDTLGRLEQYLAAIPPREVHCRGFQDEVWISWKASGQCAGQNLYRRSADSSQWTRINQTPLSESCQMFVDRPDRAGQYIYGVTALAGDGWESPHSHSWQAAYGDAPGTLRIVACKPFGAVEQGETFAVDVAVIAERGVRHVALCWRLVGADEWQKETMRERFRDTYAGVLPQAAMVKDGIIEWYLEAEDIDGTRVIWPESAEAGPAFSLIVLMIGGGM